MIRILDRTWNGLKWTAKRLFIVACVTVPIYAVANNFTLTQGAGTTFSSKVISATNYLTHLVCDATVGVTQCAAVDSSGGVSVAGEGAAGTPAGGVLTVQGSGSGTALPVSAASLPLPAGASTSALQTTGNTTLSSINTTLTNGNQVTTLTGTVPLPTGASTSALQTTGNTTLSSINTSLTNGTQVTSLTGTVPLPTGAATSALQTAGNTTLSSINTTLTNGSQTTLVTQPTSSNLKAQVDPLTISTWGMAVVGLGTAPTNMQVGGLVCDNSTLTPTAGQSAALQGDANCNLKVFVSNATALGAAAAASSSPVTLPILNHASTPTLGTSLVVKSSAAQVSGINCVGIQGAAAGFCILYNGTSAPSTGALTGANVLDACYFDTTARGCSLQYGNGTIAASSGAVVLISSGAGPLTYTTGTDTGFISGTIN